MSYLSIANTFEESMQLKRNTCIYVKCDLCEILFVVFCMYKHKVYYMFYHYAVCLQCL